MLACQSQLEYNPLRQIGHRILRMPRGQGTASMKLPAKQEMEDVWAWVLSSIVDALEASNKQATSQDLHSMWK